MWKTSSRCNGGDGSGVKEPQAGTREWSPWRQRPRKIEDRTQRAQPTGPVTPTSKKSSMAIVLANGAETQACSKPIPKNQNVPSTQSLGGKLLKALRRKMLSSSSGRMSPGASENSSLQDDKPKLLQDASAALAHQNKDEETLSQASSHESLSVDQLQEELLVLRHRLDKDRAEMHKLRKEVTLLRLAGTPVSSHSQHQVQAPPLSGDSAGNLVTRTDSVRSDVSCLDFSLASSGLLKFEGEAKANVKSVSDHDESAEESIEQMDLYLSDTTAASILNGGRNFQVRTLTNKGQEMESAVKCNTASLLLQDSEMRQMDGASAKISDDRKGLVDGDVGEPEFVTKHCHDHTSADLKLTDTLNKISGLQIFPARSTDEAEEYRNGSSEASNQLACNSSRSPPKSASSADDLEADTVPFSYTGPKTDSSDTDSEKSFILHKEDLLKVASSMAVGVGPTSTAAGRLDDHKTLREVPMLDMQYQHMEGRSRRVDLPDSGNHFPEPEARRISDVRVTSCRTSRRITLSPLAEKLRTDLKTPSEEDLLRPRSSLSVAEFEAGIEWTRQQGAKAELVKSEDNLSRSISSPKFASPSLKAQTKSTSISELQASDDAPVRVTMFSRSRSQGFSSASNPETSGISKVDTKVLRASGADVFSGPTSSSPRRSSVDLGCGLGSTSSKAESRYPELELDKLSNTLKSLRQESTPSSPVESQRTSKLIFRSSSSVDRDKTPRLSLDSQTKAFIFSDSPRIGSQWNSERSSPSRTLSPSRTINASVEGRISTVDNVQERSNDKTRLKWSNDSSSPGRQHAQRSLHSSSPLSSQKDERRSQSKNYDEKTYSREGGRSPSKIRGESRASRDTALSPSRNCNESLPWRDVDRSPSRSVASESQLKEIVNNAMLKSGSDAPIPKMLSAPSRTLRSRERLVSENQAPHPQLSTSRVLFSDPSSSPIIDRRHDHQDGSHVESGRKIQREEPFSVLALSRRRRSLEKSVSSPHGSPDLQQQQPGGPHAEESGRSSPSERRTSGFQSGKADADGRRTGGADVENSNSKQQQRFSPNSSWSYESSESWERAGSRGPGANDDRDDQIVECGTIDIGPLESNGDEGLSVSGPRSLQEAVDAWDKRRGGAGLDTEEHKLNSISSMPVRSQRSRSRFYLEAKDAGLYRTQSLANDILLTS